MQENTVRTMKHLIRHLSANKTQSAIDRATVAAETIKAVTATCFDDGRTLAKSLRKCRSLE